MGANEGTIGGDGLVRFVIPSLPPSVNALHNVIWSQRRVELKPEVRAWRSQAKQYIPRVTLGCSFLRVDVVVHYPFYHANGKLRIFDSHNLLKPLLDVIAEKIGVNDNCMKAGSWDSKNSDNEKVEVILRALP